MRAVKSPTYMGGSDNANKAVESYRRSEVTGTPSPRAMARQAKKKAPTPAEAGAGAATLPVGRWWRESVSRLKHWRGRGEPSQPRTMRCNAVLHPCQWTHRLVRPLS